MKIPCYKLDADPVLFNVLEKDEEALEWFNELDIHSYLTQRTIGFDGAESSLITGKELYFSVLIPEIYLNVLIEELNKLNKNVQVVVLRAVQLNFLEDSGRYFYTDEPTGKTLLLPLLKVWTEEGYSEKARAGLKLLYAKIIKSYGMYNRYWLGFTLSYLPTTLKTTSLLTHLHQHWPTLLSKHKEVLLWKALLVPLSMVLEKCSEIEWTNEKAEPLPSLESSLFLHAVAPPRVPHTATENPPHLFRDRFVIEIGGLGTSWAVARERQPYSLLKSAKAGVLSLEAIYPRIRIKDVVSGDIYRHLAYGSWAVERSN